MPRLSLWKDGKHSNDYKYFDKQISEMFTVGGTGINIHKYLGTTDQTVNLATNSAQPSAGTNLQFINTSNIKVGDFVYGLNIPNGTKITAKTGTSITLSNATTAPVASGITVKFSASAENPGYINESAKNIQDLLFLENRDRKYDKDIYTIRGIYTVNDSEFELTQFGLFLSSSTLFMTFHLNDMINIIGRRLMSGDVLELQHLKDYNPLDESLPIALKRFYVVSDTSRAAEGFSPTWWAHLWRVKLTPLVDSQEYKDIINNISGSDDPDVDVKLSEVISTYNLYSTINDGIITQAESDVPLSGYDTTPLYTKGLRADGMPEDPYSPTVDETDIFVDDSELTADQIIQSPDKSIAGYLTGDGLAPNGLTVTSGVSFPTSPKFGQYFLRLDFMPNRLFRYNGKKWVKVEDAVRTSLTQGTSNKTLRSGFVNNTNTYTNSSGDSYSERQALNEIFKPKAD